MSNPLTNGRFHFEIAPRVRHQNKQVRSKARPDTDKQAKKRTPQAKPVAVEAKVPAIDVMKVVSADGGWALMVDGLDEPAWVVSTKAKAVESATNAATFHGCMLKIHTGSGKLQKELDFSSAA